MEGWYEPDFITEAQATNVRVLADAVEKSFDARADPHALYLMASQLRDAAASLVEMIAHDIEQERGE